MRLPLWYYRISRFEFWQTWVLYIPLFPVWVIHSLRARSFAYFTAANPSIPLGGLFGESKKDILGKINPAHLPEWFFSQQDEPVYMVLDKMKNSGIGFPVIAKPDVGERGNRVEKIENEQQLEKYASSSENDFLVQEYVDYKEELGVLYYRMPGGGRSGILSVARKKFLSVTGNGKKSMKELVNENLMGRMREKYLSGKFKDQWNEIITAGKEIQLEPIGNHCRGTVFINSNHLISPLLVKVFDSIAQGIDGFYYGRFDLRCKSIDDLLQGKNFKILELNGVSSDPAHIYDSSMPLWKAYRDIYRCIKTVYLISVENHRRGISYAKSGEVAGVVMRQFFGGKRERAKTKY